MSVDDTRAIQKIERGQLMLAIGNEINFVWDAVENLPADQQHAIRSALSTIWKSNQAMNELLEVDEAVMHEAQAVISGLQAMTSTLTGQRDQALHDLDQIVQAANNPWGTRHPVIAPLYDRLMDAHNEAFWESLPYDMAAVLGDDWSHMDANELYDAITMDLEEKEDGAEDYGYTKDQLIQFRAGLLKLTQWLQNGGAPE